MRAPRRGFFFFDDGGPGSRAACLHFSPPDLGHAVTVAYPSRPGTAARRACWNLTRVWVPSASVTLGAVLPMDRPALRVGNAMDAGVGHLGENVGASAERHAIPPGLPASHVVGTALRARVVRYYHYMQDRFDGGGWGCCPVSADAVFVVSTAALLVRAVPTHRGIQECLCRIGINRRVSWGANSGSGPSSSVTCWTSCSMACKIMIAERHDGPGRSSPGTSTTSERRSRRWTAGVHTARSGL